MHLPTHHIMGKGTRIMLQVQMDQQWGHQCSRYQCIISSHYHHDTMCIPHNPQTKYSTWKSPWLPRARKFWKECSKGKQCWNSSPISSASCTYSWGCDWSRRRGTSRCAPVCRRKCLIHPEMWAFRVVFQHGNALTHQLMYVQCFVVTCWQYSVWSVAVWLVMQCLISH